MPPLAGRSHSQGAKQGVNNHQVTGPNVRFKPYINGPGRRSRAGKALSKAPQSDDMHVQESDVHGGVGAIPGGKRRRRNRHRMKKGVESTHADKETMAVERTAGASAQGAKERNQGHNAGAGTNIRGANAGNVPSAGAVGTCDGASATADAASCGAEPVGAKNGANSGALYANVVRGDAARACGNGGSVTGPVGGHAPVSNTAQIDADKGTMKTERDGAMATDSAVHLPDSNNKGGPGGAGSVSRTRATTGCGDATGARGRSDAHVTRPRSARKAAKGSLGGAGAAMDAASAAQCVDGDALEVESAEKGSGALNGAVSARKDVIVDADMQGDASADSRITVTTCVSGAERSASGSKVVDLVDDVDIMEIFDDEEFMASVKAEGGEGLNEYWEKCDEVFKLFDVPVDSKEWFEVCDCMLLYGGMYVCIPSQC
jgi:hypothetical protein